MGLASGRVSRLFRPTNALIRGSRGAVVTLDGLARQQSDKTSKVPKGSLDGTCSKLNGFNAGLRQRPISPPGVIFSMAVLAVPGAAQISRKPG